MAKIFQDGITIDSDTRQVLGVGRLEGAIDPPSINLPSITGSATPPVSSGTDGIRGDASALDNLGQATLNFVEEKASSPDLSAALATLTAQRDKINTFSQEDLVAIDQAGSAAGMEYDPLIAEAEAAKRAGMPKAIIGAGERGGLMNTQFSGAAALTPTEGGTFVGAGGELERIKSVYDDNISKIKMTKNQAIANAKIAARQAIRTGKKEDFDTAKGLYELARQSQQDTLDLQAKKLTAINNYNQEKRLAEQDKIKNKLEADKFDFDKYKYDYELEHPEIKTNTRELVGPDGLMHAVLYNTATGETIQDMGATQNIIADMAKKYSDAGIIPTDTLAVAMAKQKNSKIYKDEIRGLVGTVININSETGLTPAQTTAAKAKYLTVNAPKGKTDKDFDALASSEKLMWFGGGPEADPAVTEITKVINEQKDFLASIKGDWETAYNTLVGRDANLGKPLTEADRQQIQASNGFYPDPSQYQTMADIMLDKPTYYTK